MHQKIIVKIKQVSGYESDLETEVPQKVRNIVLNC